MTHWQTCAPECLPEAARRAAEAEARVRGALGRAQAGRGAPDQHLGIARLPPVLAHDRRLFGFPRTFVDHACRRFKERDVELQLLRRPA